MINRILIALFSLYLLQPGLVIADSKQVQIEVVVFQSLALRGWTEELWPDAETLASKLTMQSKAISPHSNKNFAKLLPNDQLTMHAQVEKMTPDKGYQVLAHFGWLQETLPQQDSLPVLIDQTLQQHRQDTSSIYGSLRFYQERFAHIDLELELDRIIPASIKQRFAEHQQLDPEWLNDSWRFQIKESRRIRPGEIHYLDHPIFGVLVKFNRVN